MADLRGQVSGSVVSGVPKSFKRESIGVADTMKGQPQDMVSITQESVMKSMRKTKTPMKSQPQ